MAGIVRDENKYIVFKSSDVEAAVRSDLLDPAVYGMLQALRDAVDRVRGRRGKLEPFRAVVVESDWPEYEPTWNAIEQRYTGTRFEKTMHWYATYTRVFCGESKLREMNGFNMLIGEEVENLDTIKGQQHLRNDITDSILRTELQMAGIGEDQATDMQIEGIMIHSLTCVKDK